MSEIDYSGLPASLRPGMRRYIEQRVETGSFLRAVIEGNRDKALQLADPGNAIKLQEIFHWAAENIPAEARGAENCRKWIEAGKARLTSLEAFE